LSSEKSPTWLRIAQIVLGAITIALSAAVLANPDVTTLIFVTLLGIALITVGIAKIIEGALARHLSKGVRAIGIGIGIVSIVGGFFALSNPITAIATLILVITIFILIHGAGLIAAGISSRSESKASRIANIIIGAIVIGFSAILFASPGLALVMMVIFLSIALLFNGIGSIISGITGNRRLVKMPS